MEKINGNLMVTLTVEQFCTLQKELLASHQQQIKEETKKLLREFVDKEIGKEKKFTYGLKGLAKVLGCSRSHAAKVKASGILDEAISQNGNLIIVDVALALELFNEKK